MKNPKPKITTEIIKRHYVMIGDSIYGGPFYNYEDAQQCLAELNENRERYGTERRQNS